MFCGIVLIMWGIIAIVENVKINRQAKKCFAPPKYNKKQKDEKKAYFSTLPILLPYIKRVSDKWTDEIEKEIKNTPKDSEEIRYSNCSSDYGDTTGALGFSLYGDGFTDFDDMSSIRGLTEYMAESASKMVIEKIKSNGNCINPKFEISYSVSGSKCRIHWLFTATNKNYKPLKKL